MRNSFTLLEILISVVLIFIIGMSLTEISNNNTNAIIKDKNTRFELASLVIQSSNTYREIRDYFKIKDIPNPDILVDRKKEFLYNSMIVLDENTSVEVSAEKETVIINDETLTFFRFQ